MNRISVFGVILAMIGAAGLIWMHVSGFGTTPETASSTVSQLNAATGTAQE